MSWILLRGLTREARHWGAFTSLLAQRSGEDVVTLDLPGSGEFAALPSPALPIRIRDTRCSNRPPRRYPPRGPTSRRASWCRC